jgi:hypothetical protein
VSADLLPATAHAFADELDSAFGRITHCLDQLTDEQVWGRPRPDMNAIGNLLLHLTGNLRQYVVSGVGGEPDHRDRPAEFAARETLPKAELQRRLADVVSRAKAVIAAATAEELCRTRRVQTTDVTGIQAVVRSVAHFRGHAQEIIHLTRTVLADRYRYAGMP